MRSGIVAWHVGNAVAGENGHGGGICGRRYAEPSFMHFRDGPIEFHAFDGDIKHFAQLAGILAQRRGPDEPSRI